MAYMQCQRAFRYAYTHPFVGCTVTNTCLTFSCHGVMRAYMPVIPICSACAYVYHYIWAMLAYKLTLARCVGCLCPSYNERKKQHRREDTMNNTRRSGKTQSGKSFYAAFSRKLTLYHLAYVQHTLLRSDKRDWHLSSPRYTYRRD